MTHVVDSNSLRLFGSFANTIIPTINAPSMLTLFLSFDVGFYRYVPPVGSPGSSLTTFTKAAIGSLGTNATTLSWNVTLNLTVVDDRAVPTVDLTPMDGGLIFVVVCCFFVSCLNGDVPMWAAKNKNWKKNEHRLNYFPL